VRRIAILLATWFGCGYFPFGPGTIGSLAAVGIAALIRFYSPAARLILFGLILILLPPAIWASTETARALARKDPGQVVVDEVLGQWVTLLGTSSLHPMSFGLGFVVFRIFDIWKPWPVRQFEMLPEGLGIVADDLAAGVYGALILYIGGTLRIY